MRRQLKQVIFFIFYITSLVIAIPQITYADESIDTSGIGYNYRIIKPSNQVGDTGYFDLRMEPNQKQTVEVELYNITDKEMTIEMAVNSAKTNSNGVIEYGPTTIKNDPSLKYDIKDIVKVPEKVTIPPNDQTKISVEITMPEEKYDGHISGGIYLKRAETEEEKKANQKAKGVINKYAFLIGILLSESDTKVQPNLLFNKIYPDLTNYRNAFMVNFSNTEMNYVEGMSVDVQIFKKGSDEALYDSKKANYRMAPNSMIDFPVSLNGEEFEAGDYTGHILITAGERKWEWKEDFKVTKEDAEKYNAQDVSLVQERGINWKMIAIIVGVILLVLIIIFSMVRVFSKKKKKQRNKKSLKKKT
ncbi:DUF916 and DUF3324 domain-containing protein [Enterococcus quebecensis]|uniref:Uncharacterized protein n=1 Tax=Enterococcus quebecensis TaxID=903983 RepID=A0A1E5GR81_9ENTE|nr:DUF916 and DUF3324 domain-containing protein [Enterococcus quebecensis]OEG15197.1 hypothetical protein BCR23_10190 [Enterococcus quebecensis]OJG74775.1 hypothetical protein RV12_GL002192 [Enterococcus quebecensis]